MNYFELQEAVFNYLWNKHQQDHSFTFSVRQMASNGAQKNYFIGTERSNYFAFTCWDIPVYYPGSSGDLTGFIFMNKDGKWQLKFQYGMAKSATGEQSAGNLAFGYELRKDLENAGVNVWRNDEGNRMLYYHVQLNNSSLSTFDEVIQEWEELYKLVAPVVDASIENTKVEHPKWQAGRYKKAKFDTLIHKMHQRIEKFKNATPTEIDDLHEEDETDNIESFSRPLNTILYGPPGTGKTYKLQTLINEMQLVEAAQSASTDYSTFVSGFTWWQLLAMALIEKKKLSVPELLEHPLVKAKLATSNIQHPPQRLWSTLQHHTVKSCPNVKGERRFGELIFYKEADSTWRLDNETDFKQQFPYLVTEWENFTKGNGPGKEQKNYTFVTCHQSLTYEDFIEGIKPSLEQKEEADSEEKLQYQIRKGLFYQACEKAAQKAGFTTLKEALEVSKEIRKEKFNKAKEENNIHVLFLDEINRCNVSAVLGELITLIEDDKRLGANNEIADISLPYSQSLFGVPSNLFIIGTMNTADRSVEALDTALRRRFVFGEMQPKPELLSTKFVLTRLLNSPDTEDNNWTDDAWRKHSDPFYEMIGAPDGLESQLIKIEQDTYEGPKWIESYLQEIDTSVFTGMDLEQMLRKINQRLEALLTKDHTIGHAWLMDVYSLSDLQNAFKNKILPLLQEFFYNNYAKIGLVLGKAFIDTKPAKGIFAKDFDGDNDLKSDYEEKIIYSLKDPFELELQSFIDIYK